MKKITNDGKKYAMFFDIDGTIYFHGYVPLRVWWAIRKAQKMGHYVIINTGRTPFFLPPRLKRMIKWDGFVCCGSLGIMGGKEVFGDFFTREDLTELCKIIDKYNLPVSFDRASGISYFVHCPKPYINKFENALDVLAEFDTARINKVEIRTAIGDDIRSEVAKYASPYNMGRYSDVFITGNNKGVALEKMAKVLGVPLENTVAFGDNMNDYDMLKTAGVSFAMSSAPKELREIATHTETSKKVGVYYAIKKLLKL